MNIHTAWCQCEFLLKYHLYALNASKMMYNLPWNMGYIKESLPPSKETIEAMIEAEHISSDRKANAYSVANAFNELDK